VSAGSPPVQAARLIRAGIRKAVEEGALGVLPPGVSFSVRGFNFATSPGVGITIYGVPAKWPETSACDELRGKLMEIAARYWQPADPGWTEVNMISAGTRQRDEPGPAGLARGDIPGRPRAAREAPGE